jgi:hypothetical protein
MHINEAQFVTYRWNTFKIAIYWKQIVYKIMYMNLYAPYFIIISYFVPIYDFTYIISIWIKVDNESRWKINMFTPEYFTKYTPVVFFFVYLTIYK